jgi:hypothetical protein
MIQQRINQRRKDTHSQKMQGLIIQKMQIFIIQA